MKPLSLIFKNQIHYFCKPPSFLTVNHLHPHPLYFTHEYSVIPHKYHPVCTLPVPCPCSHHLASQGSHQKKGTVQALETLERQQQRNRTNSNTSRTAGNHGKGKLFCSCRVCAWLTDHLATRPQAPRNASTARIIKRRQNKTTSLDSCLILP